MDFLAAVVGEEVRTIDEDLGGGYVRLAISEAARRQAKHDIRCVEDVVIELLRNARDAHATHIYLATAREGQRRLIVAIDDGIGIDPFMWEQVFEPRVTSKLETVHVDEWGIHGRGMALYSIRHNTESAQVKASDQGRGAALVVEIDTEILPEKADQSSLPTMTDNEGDTQFRGPHNIARTVAEFAHANPQIEVYLGSPAEIAATLHNASKRDWIADPLVAALDAATLSEAAADIGLEISERTAYRILSKRIAAAQRLSLVAAGPRATDPHQREFSYDELEHDARGLRIAPDDMAAFKLDLQRAFDALGEKYYLDQSEDVHVKQSGDSINATFRFEKQ
jgi:hypothetical protein